MRLPAEFLVDDWHVRPELNQLGRLTPGRGADPDPATRLEPKVMQVLVALARCAPRVATKQELLAEVWGEAFVTDEVLTNAIWEIRHALGDDARAPRYLETIRGRGYRLMRAVEPVPTPRAPAMALPAFARGPRRDRWAPIVLPVLGLVLFAGFLWNSTDKAPSLTQDLAPDLEPGRDADPELQALIHRGQYHLSQGTPGEREKAFGHFLQAVARDPSHAPAFAGLAESFPLTSTGGKGQRFEVAKAAAERAVLLDTSDVDAQLALGRLLGAGEWDWDGAGHALRRAIQLEPDNAKARHRYASYLTILGRTDEALAELDHAAAIDPSYPSLAANRVRVLYLARRHVQAIAEAQAILTHQPEASRVRLLLALNHLARDEVDAAREALQAIGKVGAWKGELGYAAAAAGDPAAARRLLDQLLSGAQPNPYQVALIHLGLGNHSVALDWLERGAADRHPEIIRLAVDPRFEALQDEPGLQSLLLRLGLA